MDFFRLDFIDFELDPPVIDPNTNVAECDEDLFVVRSNGMHPTGLEEGICGTNTGQHSKLTIFIPP